MSIALSRPAESTTPRAAEPPTAVGPRVERIGADCYVVLDESHPIGFIDVAGEVFVALRGRRYDRAVEVGQSRGLQAAVALVLEEHGAHRRTGTTA